MATLSGVVILLRLRDAKVDELRKDEYGEANEDDESPGRVVILFSCLGMVFHFAGLDALVDKANILPTTLSRPITHVTVVLVALAYNLMSAPAKTAASSVFVAVLALFVVEASHITYRVVVTPALLVAASA